MKKYLFLILLSNTVQAQTYFTGNTIQCYCKDVGFVVGNEAVCRINSKHITIAKVATNDTVLFQNNSTDNLCVTL
jgi:hypothetical protein